MSMNVGTTGSVTNTQADYKGYSNAGNVSKTENKESTKPVESVGAVYEKSDAAVSKPATYSVGKMSAEDRKALVSQLQADVDARKQSLVNLVNEMLGKQAKAYGQASGEDSIWKFLAGGNFTVDAQTKAQAQADIAEDGYWGVKQTSQRLFDFASALAGDDVEKMKEMQQAMMKGYEMATHTWGGKLPDISKQTIDAANKLFDDYYASKTPVDATTA